MIKQSGVEDSGVTDASSGGRIKVSTTARILYRKMNPSWGKSKNKELNQVIAQQYSASDTKDFFKPKVALPQEARGEIREGGGVKFIAITFPDETWVISVKGTPKIGVPAPVHLPEQHSRDMWQRGHRGFLENHFFDLFDGMYALDPNGYEAILNAAKASEHPIKYMRDLHNGGKGAVAGAAAALLGEMSVKQVNMEPTDSDVHRIMSVPVGMKL